MRPMNSCLMISCHLQWIPIVFTVGKSTKHPFLGQNMANSNQDVQLLSPNCKLFTAPSKRAGCECMILRRFWLGYHFNTRILLEGTASYLSSLPLPFITLDSWSMTHWMLVRLQHGLGLRHFIYPQKVWGPELSQVQMVTKDVQIWHITLLSK